MSVLIKGMEIPSKCSECMLFDVFGGYCKYLKEFLDSDKYNKWRDVRCPLVNIPPHGDLIDRDKLRKHLKIAKNCSDCKWDRWDMCKQGVDLSEICYEIDTEDVVLTEEK